MTEHYDMTNPHQTTVSKLEEMCVRAVSNNLDFRHEALATVVPYINDSAEHEAIDFRNAVKRGKILVK